MVLGTKIVGLAMFAGTYVARQLHCSYSVAARGEKGRLRSVVQALLAPAANPLYPWNDYVTLSRRSASAPNSTLTGKGTTFLSPRADMESILKSEPM